MPTVAGFNLTPVKSTSLLQPDEIELRREGAVGDRRFLFVRGDGARISGISKGPLLPIRSSWDRSGQRLSLRFADGTLVEGDATAAGDPLDVALFDRTVTARSIDPVFTDAVRELVDDTLMLLRVDEPEYAGGIHRVSIAARASITDVGARGGASSLDARRFRMLVELDGLEPFEEDTWNGRRVRIGEAVVRAGDPMPRCIMTTLGPDSGEKDFPTLHVLAGYRQVGQELMLGVYGDVEEPGRVRVGDPVELLPG